MFLAKALYDNVAETPDELAFRRGDVLTILEREPSSLEGWWLCTLRGRRGIVPANRLRSLAGGGDPGGGTQDQDKQNMNMINNMHGGGQMGGDTTNHAYQQEKAMASHRGYNTLPSSDYDVPRPKNATTSSSILNYGSLGSKASLKPQSDTYDFPRASLSRNVSQEGEEGTYDVPKAHGRIGEEAMQCGSDRSSTISSLSLSSKASTDHSSVETHDYDVPPAAKLAKTPEKILEVPGSCYDTLPKARLLGEETNHKNDDHDSSCLTDDSYSEISDIPLKEESDKCGFDAGDYVDDCTFPHSTPSMMSHNSSHGGLDISSEFLKMRVSQGMDDYDVPRNSRCSLDTSMAGSSLNMSSDPHAIYDIPPQVTKDSGRCSMDLSNRLSAASSHSSGGEEELDVSFRQLRLNVDTALDHLVKLQQEVHASCSKMLSFVNPKWRHRENLEPKLYSIRLACVAIKSSLQDYTEFISGAQANARCTGEQTLRSKLMKHLRPVQDALLTVTKHLKGIEGVDWMTSSLAMDETEEAGDSDDLDGIVAASRTIPIQARTLTLLVQANAKTLFPSKNSARDSSFSDVSGSDSLKRSSPTHNPSYDSMKRRPLPPTPQCNNSNLSQSSTDIYNTPKTADTPKESRPSDYDYVQLTKQSDTMHTLPRESAHSHKTPPGDYLSLPRTGTSGLSTKFKEKLDALQKDGGIGVNVQMSSTPTIPCKNSPRHNNLHENDVKILVFYLVQTDAHITALNSARDVFMKGIEAKQPPKVFIAHSKHLVVSAHKLVYIADTITRNLMSEDVRNKLTSCASRLCDALKSTVVSTKNAALNYPSEDVTQEMVENVWGVSFASSELRNIIAQASDNS